MACKSVPNAGAVLVPIALNLEGLPLGRPCHPIGHLKRVAGERALLDGGPGCHRPALTSVAFSLVFSTGGGFHLPCVSHAVSTFPGTRIVDSTHERAETAVVDFI